MRIFSLVLALFIYVYSASVGAQRDPIACLMVLCVYAAANGEGDTPGCNEPLGIYKKIKKTTGVLKELDCPATIAERIIQLSFCTENIYPLHEIVGCDE